LNRALLILSALLGAILLLAATTAVASPSKESYIVVLTERTAPDAAASAPAVPASAEIEGRAASGSRPLVSTPVALYRATSGDPVALARSVTRADGSFQLSYRQPRHRDVLYVIVGRGAAVRLAAVLGSAPRPRSVVVNERTTVATGFALAQFISGRRIAGSFPGLQNAAGMARNLADPRTGAAARVLQRSPNGPRTTTLRTFNSLANMLSRCVRASARGCGRLLRLADAPRGDRPRGTLAAVAEIARNPWHNVRRLARLARSGPMPYRPALRASTPPAAWTLALRFVGDGSSMSGPGNIAIDARGNPWVTNNYEYSRDRLKSVCGSNLLLKFTPTGRYAPGSPYSGGGLSGAGFGITLDPDGNVWVGNFGFAAPGCQDQPPHNSVSKFAPSGRALSPDAGFTGPTRSIPTGSISWPQGTVSDRRGNIWIANCGNHSVTRYRAGNPPGNPLAWRNFGKIGLEKPFDIAFNGRGRAFVTGNGTSNVVVLRPDGTPTARSPIESGGINKPLGIAADSRGNMWVANSGLIDVPCTDPDISTDSGSLTLIERDGTVAAGSPFKGGGLTVPWGVAVDGNDNVWVANFAGRRLSQFCGTAPAHCPPGARTGDPISPRATGYRFNGLVRNTGVAIDPSGNVWLANNWKIVPIQANPGGYQMVAYVGLAAPLKTPLIGPPRSP
jgi:sugar lactone lactonase YvrE